MPTPFAGSGATWKRFHGPGEQWATHGGYYLGSGSRGYNFPSVQSRPMMTLTSPQGMHEPITGGLAKIVGAGVQGWKQGQRAARRATRTGAKVPSTALGPTEQTQNAQERQQPSPLELGGGPAPYGGYYEGTNKPMPPEKTVSTNFPPPVPPRVQSAPASLTKSRLEAFKFQPSSRSIPDPF